MKIIIPPHHKPAHIVESLEEIKTEADEMIKLIEANAFEGKWKQAYALAHPQVSYQPKTFFVVNKTISAIRQEFKTKIIINPEILKMEDRRKVNEGCMGLPYKGGYKKLRFNYIKVEYYVPGWFGKLKKKTASFSGLAAQIFQHELEHINGDDRG